MENVRTVREGETLVFPLTAPKGINRLYFKFGQPIEVSKEIVDDKESCEAVYLETKRRLWRGWCTCRRTGRTTRTGTSSQGCCMSRTPPRRRPAFLAEVAA